MQSVDYRMDPVNGFESYARGLQLGNAVKQMEQQASIQSKINELLQKQNPTAEDFLAVATYLPKDQAENIQKSWAQIGQDRQASDLKFGAQVMSAFSANRNDLGVSMLKQRAEAFKNSGNLEDAQVYDTYAQIAESNPEVAKNTIGIMMASLPGGDKFLSSALGASKDQYEISKSKTESENLPEKLYLENQYTKSQIRNVDDQIQSRSEQLNLDKDKFRSDVEAKIYEMRDKTTDLSSDAKKIVNDAVVSAVSANESANNMINLANRLDNLNGGYGKFSKASEWIKGALGNENAWTQVRQEYVRLRNTQAIKSLPPGPATDRDIELALKGFPSENSDSRVLSSFIRGMAKMQQFESKMQNTKSEWVSAVGSLGKNKEEIEVGGVVVPAGTNYVDFVNNFVYNDKQKSSTAQQNNGIANRSYMRWARQ